MTGAPQILLAHHLKTLRLPTFLREYAKQARRRTPPILRQARRRTPPILRQARRRTPPILKSARIRARGAAEGLDHVQFLARPVEPEPIDRERRMVERRIKAAFAFVLGPMAANGSLPTSKSLDSFDFRAVPKLNRMQVLELARCDRTGRRENVIALGPSGTGKTHLALGLGPAACQKGLSASFTTAAAFASGLEPVAPSLAHSTS